MKRSLEDRLRARIARSARDVFLTRDFRDLGGRGQVARGLRKLVCWTTTSNPPGFARTGRPEMRDGRALA